MDIIFVHPDLGIGGAERLVVDAALSLQHRGHSVKIWTSHHDNARCFPETIQQQPASGKHRHNGDTIVVEVHGRIVHPNWLKGKFTLPFAIARNFLLSCVLIWQVWTGKLSVDLLVIDQISACIPLLTIALPHKKILFYCHFPDRLLVVGRRESWMKRLYRIPFDIVEELSTGMADSILVNSKFTAKVFKSEFSVLKLISRVLRLDISPNVLYPAVKLPNDRQPQRRPNCKKFISINRYERKKNIQLAIDAFIQLAEQSSSAKDKLQLIVAGGYDARVKENVEYHQELVDSVMAKTSIIKSIVSFPPNDPSSALSLLPSDSSYPSVVFMANISDEEKMNLLNTATALIYTPAFEHFGIVPIEAMASRCVVVGQNSGGPTETIVDGKTGYLFNGTVEDLRRIMHDICELTGDELNLMGRRGRQRCLEMFSLDVFGEQLEKYLKAMQDGNARKLVKLMWTITGVFMLLRLYYYYYYN